jgi:putative transposase
MMCQALEVSKSGFYDWRSRPVAESTIRRMRVRAEIVRVFEGEDPDNGGRTYGYRRVHAELGRRGIELDDDTVRLHMRALGLVPVQVKRRCSLTKADRAAGPLPDLVRRDFTAPAPWRKLVGDITQIDTGEGPLFLATVLDCFSKSVAGWAIDTSYPATLVSAAIEMAAARFGVKRKKGRTAEEVDADAPIFHSDRGSQYTSREFARVLAEYDIRQSVGRTGICFDNSMAESFFGKLKTELTHHRRFATRAEARRAIVKYIEGFYNCRRLHSSVGYRTPLEVLEEWFANQQAA